MRHLDPRERHWIPRPSPNLDVDLHGPVNWSNLLTVLARRFDPHGDLEAPPPDRTEVSLKLWGETGQAGESHASWRLHSRNLY